MTDSTLLVTEADPALMTWGHELDGRGRPFASKVYPYNRMHTPSSNLHSNVRDMARWAIANLDGGELDGKRILERATRETMWTPAREITAAGPDVRRQAIGLSWFLGQHRGHGSSPTAAATPATSPTSSSSPRAARPSSGWPTSTGSASRLLTRAALDAALGLTPEPIVSKRSAGRVLDGHIPGRRPRRRAEAVRRHQSRGQADLYDLGEDELNTFGYFLLGEKKTDEALRVFRMNIEAFPKSANAQDSLGEALEIAGDKAAARGGVRGGAEARPQLHTRQGRAGEAAVAHPECRTLLAWNLLIP